MQSAPRPVEDPPRFAPFKRHGRILLALLAVLILVGLAPLATMSFKLIRINREAWITAHQEFQLLLASSIGHELEAQVGGLENQLLGASGRLAATIRRDGVVSETDLQRELSDVADERIPYLRYTYFHKQGVRSIGNGVLPAALEETFADGLRQAAEVLVQHSTPDAERQAWVSEPIVLPADPPRTVLVLSAPIIARGSFHGVLSGLVDLQSVWEAIAERNHTGNLVFAIDQHGTVFASGDAERISPGQDVRQSPLVQKFLARGGRAGETIPFTLWENGESEPYTGSYEQTRLGWGILVQGPKRLAEQPMQAMVQGTVRWALGALALAGVVAVFFARTLSNPINRLAKASHAFAAGDFSTRVHVRTRNEIGELADTFNRMADEIELHVKRLRQAAEENRELFLGTARAMAQAIDAKDPYTRGHSERVNRYSVILARELRLPEAHIEDIHVSSLLHDVGKIGIDDAILNKPGKLTDAEFEIMKTHTTRGANIMQPIRQMERMLPGLRWHHEQWRGGGYPDGLAGEQIPLMARIIAVADTFDAITTDRPYQQRMTFEGALARLEEVKGVRLDPRIVDVFQRAWRAGVLRPEAAAEELDEAVVAGVG